VPAIGTVTDRALAAALAQAETNGVIKPQEVFQLQAEASRSLGSHPLARAALTTWGSLFQLAEQYNRRVAFIAAWRTATEEGIANPFRFAEDAVDATQGVFNKGNRPNIARGAAGATIMTFRQFLIQYVEFLSRLPLRHKALALAVIALLSGVRGIPFWEDLEDLIDTLAQSMGYNWQTRDQMNRWLASTLGSGLADFLQRGVSGIAGFPVDVSARMGMANIVPATDLLKPSNTHRLDSFLEIFGVSGGYVRDALKGEFRPVAVRNAAKGLDMAETGMARDSRGRKVADATAVDAAVKALGFQPGEIGRESFKVSGQYDRRALYSKTKSEITEQWALGYFEKDPAKRQAAQERMAAWNRKNPEQQITVRRQDIARRVKEMGRDRTERFVRSTPKALRPAAAEAFQ